jgi:hypothetical protein
MKTGIISRSVLFTGIVMSVCLAFVSYSKPAFAYTKGCLTGAECWASDTGYGVCGAPGCTCNGFTNETCATVPQ